MEDTSKGVGRMRMRLPEEFRRRMERLLGEESAAFYAALDGPAHRGLRVNTLKCTVEAFRKRFPLPLTPVPFSPAGFLLHGDWKAGAIPGIMRAPIICRNRPPWRRPPSLDPRPGEAILDLCAGARRQGNRIAAALQGRGLLWANEIVGTRAQILQQNLERCGVRNAVVSGAEPALLAEKLGARFDGVLVDAPCSGEGMFRKEPGRSGTMESRQYRAVCRRQRGILRSAAASSAREGGCCIPPAHLPRRKTNGRWGRSWSNTRISFWKTSGRLDSAALAFPRRRSPPSPCRKTALFPPPSPLNGAGVSCPRTGAKGISCAVPQKGRCRGVSLFHRSDKI